MSFSKLPFRKNGESSHYPGSERRRSERLAIDQSIRFERTGSPPSNSRQLGKSKNISSDGILFRAVNPLPRKSYILIEIDQRAMNWNARFQHQVATIQGKLVGKVVRTHLNLENGLFDIGVQFLANGKQGEKEVKEALAGSA